MRKSSAYPVYCFLSVCLFFFVQLSTAQVRPAATENSVEKLMSTQLFSVSSLNGDKVTASAQSSVYITQVGTNNKVQTISNSFESSVVVSQYGMDNRADLNVNGLSVYENILQVGYRNSITDYSSTALHKNTEIIQNGNHQNLYIHGRNSITENMKITMTGGGFGQEVIITSF